MPCKQLELPELKVYKELFGRWVVNAVKLVKVPAKTKQYETLLRNLCWPIMNLYRMEFGFGSLDDFTTVSDIGSAD